MKSPQSEFITNLKPSSLSELPPPPHNQLHNSEIQGFPWISSPLLPQHLTSSKTQIFLKSVSSAPSLIYLSAQFNHYAHQNHYKSPIEVQRAPMVLSTLYLPKADICFQFLTRVTNHPSLSRTEGFFRMWAFSASDQKVQPNHYGWPPSQTASFLLEWQAKPFLTFPTPSSQPHLSVLPVPSSRYMTYRLCQTALSSPSRMCFVSLHLGTFLHCVSLIQNVLHLIWAYW